MMASLKLLFPCKRLRRSQRIETKEKTENINRTIEDGPLGYFEIIPLEVKFLVFTYMNVEELSMLTIASKAMRNVVELYKNTAWAPQFLKAKAMPHGPTEDPMYLKEFKRLGLLMKRSTCLYTTKDRLRLMHQFLYRFLCSFNKNCTDPSKCIALSCYGKFLHTVIAGWDDKECSRTFSFIMDNTLITKSLTTIIKSKPGTLSILHQELNARLFLRRLFIDPCSNKNDKAFWLNQILKSFAMVEQARILFMMFGPFYGDEVQWFDMCESTPVNKDHAKLCFNDLAQAFRLLHFHSKNWSEDSIISVIDEITCFPEEWLSENTANLLFLCGDCITLKVLSSKAINGRSQELANIITSLCLVCWRHSQPTTWAIDIIKGLCSVYDHPRERVFFLHMIIDTFKEILTDLHDFGDSEEESGQDFQNMMDAHSEFCRELIKLAFMNIIQQSEE